MHISETIFNIPGAIALLPLIVVLIYNYGWNFACLGDNSDVNGSGPMAEMVKAAVTINCLR